MSSFNVYLIEGYVDNIYCEKIIIIRISATNKMKLVEWQERKQKDLISYWAFSAQNLLGKIMLQRKLPFAQSINKMWNMEKKIILGAYDTTLLRLEKKWHLGKNRNPMKNVSSKKSN